MRSALLSACLLLGVPGTVAEAASPGRGWGYLIEKLVADGVPRERVLATFGDPRMEPFTGLQFSLAPGESRALYRGFLRPAGVAAARRCLQEHAGPLAAVARAQGVPAPVVAAILQVESGCGRYTGSHPILPPLARLAMAAEPANLDRNLERHLDGCPRAAADAVAERTRARARTLEATFYPEVRATFDLAERWYMDPLDIRGSDGGAFGLPQFLPTSYFRYGVDADGDGRVSLYDADDAIASCASYLAGHGWHPGLSRGERRDVIWSYNHSTAYVDTVLTLAERIGGPEPAPGARRTAKATPVRRATAPRSRSSRPSPASAQRVARRS